MNRAVFQAGFSFERKCGNDVNDGGCEQSPEQADRGLGSEQRKKCEGSFAGGAASFVIAERGEEGEEHARGNAEAPDSNAEGNSAFHEYPPKRRKIDRIAAIYSI